MGMGARKAKEGQAPTWTKLDGKVLAPTLFVGSSVSLYLALKDKAGAKPTPKEVSKQAPYPSLYLVEFMAIPLFRPTSVSRWVPPRLLL